MEKQAAEVKYKLEKHPKFGFLQIKPTPTPEEITKFYAAEFYSGDYPRLNDSSLEVQLRDKDFYQGHYDDMCQAFAEISGKDLKGLELLDIGCGWGQALLFFRQKGLVCHGFDPAPEAVAYARKQGLEVIEAGMNSMNAFKGKKFDIVTLMNVLEHLSDPVAAVKEIADHVLKPGGIIAIDVPNEFNAFQTSGRELHQLQEWWVAPPAHLNYFSGATIKNLLEGTGYTVKTLESSFPLEMFLLFGDNYVKDSSLGRTCHQKRVAFELNMRKTGKQNELRKFYQALAQLNLGRQVIAYAVKGK